MRYAFSMTTTPPANWYPDPDGSPQLRYWDGTQWTDHYHAQAPVVPAPTQQQAPAPQPLSPPPPGQWQQGQQFSQAPIGFQDQNSFQQPIAPYGNTSEFDNKDEGLFERYEEDFDRYADSKFGNKFDKLSEQFQNKRVRYIGIGGAVVIAIAAGLTVSGVI